VAPVLLVAVVLVGYLAERTRLPYRRTLLLLVVAALVLLHHRQYILTVLTQLHLGLLLLVAVKVRVRKTLITQHTLLAAVVLAAAVQRTLVAT
jgi:hypothetical protein